MHPNPRPNPGLRPHKHIAAPPKFLTNLPPSWFPLGYRVGEGQDSRAGFVAPLGSPRTMRNTLTAANNSKRLSPPPP
jgi:hypothetical protein